MLTRLKTIYQKYETWQSLLLQNQSVANKIEILKNLSKLEPIRSLSEIFSCRKTINTNRSCFKPKSNR